MLSKHILSRVDAKREVDARIGLQDRLEHYDDHAQRSVRRAVTNEGMICASECLTTKCVERSMSELQRGMSS